eukprot:9993472-Alexandrium_andersonii.AAC.1
MRYNFRGEAPASSTSGSLGGSMYSSSSRCSCVPWRNAESASPAPSSQAPSGAVKLETAIRMIRKR